MDKGFFGGENLITAQGGFYPKGGPFGLWFAVEGYIEPVLNHIFGQAAAHDPKAVEADFILLH